MEKSVYIQTEFDRKGVLERAIVIDKAKEMKVKIIRDMSTVVFEVRWRGFSVRLVKDFGVNLPGFLEKKQFNNLYKTPLEFYKGVLSIIETLVKEEYEKAQEIYEKEGE